MLSHSVAKKASFARPGGVSISTAALAAAASRLAPEGSVSGATAGGAPGANVGTKASRIASATATVDRLMTKAGSGGGGLGGLDLGLDFSKMDFKKIVDSTQSAITMERLGGAASRIRLPSAGAASGAAVEADPAQHFSSHAGASAHSHSHHRSSAFHHRGGHQGQHFDGQRIGSSSSPSSATAPTPRPSGVMDKLRDFKLSQDWEGALGLFTAAVGNPNEYRRWYMQHIAVVIDLLAGAGKVTELWKVWRLARATGKLEDATEDIANRMLFRVGRLVVLKGITAPLTKTAGDSVAGEGKEEAPSAGAEADAAAEAAQLAQWWISLVRDMVKLLEERGLPLDPRNETTVAAALSAAEPLAAVKAYMADIEATIAARGGGGSTAGSGGDVRRAARSAFHRQASGRGGPSTPGRSFAPDAADPAEAGRDGDSSASHYERRPRPEITSTITLNDALAHARTTAEVESHLATALERGIEFNDDTFARRIQRLGLRRREAFQAQKATWRNADGSLVYADGTGVGGGQPLDDDAAVAESQQQQQSSADGTDSAAASPPSAASSSSSDAAGGEEAATSNSNSATTAKSDGDDADDDAPSRSPLAAFMQAAQTLSRNAETSYNPDAEAAIVNDGRGNSTTRGGGRGRGQQQRRPRHEDRSAEHAALDAEILAEAKRLFHEANVYSNRAAAIRLFDPDLSPEAAAAMPAEELLGMAIAPEGESSEEGGDAAAPAPLPSTPLCNAVLYELRRANAFEDICRVEAMMRGPNALTAQEGRYWRISPSNKTVDHLVSAYYRAGRPDRCKELFDEAKVNYAARLSPLVYTTMIKIQSEETMPRRDAETGALSFPQRELPPGASRRAAEAAAHQELNQLIHQLAADDATHRLNDSTNVALINKWAQTRRRRR